jgi:hypothetical protein
MVCHPVAEAQSHALRARQIQQRLEQRDPGRYRHDLADVDRLLEHAEAESG